jgi:hypothetical protein
MAVRLMRAMKKAMDEHTEVKHQVKTTPADAHLTLAIESMIEHRG